MICLVIIVRGLDVPDILIEELIEMVYPFKDRYFYNPLFEVY